jgi:regulator of protease activity HflC (stomatin/prohibitin superfamily)
MAGRKVIKFLGFYILQADEVAVTLTLGKFSGVVGPGLGFALPLIKQVYKTGSSLQTIDLPDQQIVISGNIGITISGNLNFRVGDAGKALLSVSDYRFTVQRLALTTISDVLSTKTIEEVRTEKMKIAGEIEQIVAEAAVKWGLTDVDIRLTDARMDEQLLRAMMRETEAKKEASAAQIRADADRDVAESFAEAATTLSSSPGALTLKVLQTLSDLSNSKSTVVIPLPWDLLQSSAKSVLGQAEQTAAASAASSDAEEPPNAKLRYEADRTIAVCPICKAQYNVTEVMGDMRYDRMPETPGIQIRCKRCEGIFTLPGSED